MARKPASEIFATVNFRNALYAVSMLLSQYAYAQHDTFTTRVILADHIAALAAPAMLGRGYVKNGRALAAGYINDKFRTLKMAHVPGMRSFRRSYSFPVNTFPGKMSVSFNGKELVPGRDFLADAASAPYKGKKMQVKKKDLAAVKDLAGWKMTLASLSNEYAWQLDNTDTLCKALGIRTSALVRSLPEGCYIIPAKSKQIWTVSQTVMAATVLYINEGALPANITTTDIDIETKPLKHAKSKNIMAMVPGTIADSFIVFSAHYDHLGKMGTDVVFPGASDNASGTAMLLYLAAYYAAHPQRYSMVFIAFSGEEAGLLGSAHFVSDPPFRLQNIKFLTNIDIMGDATDGVTVVNATEFPQQFARLTRINDEQQYIPVIKSRGKAANSDHYHFSEKGVPAFFMYSNGGKGHYHDIYDTAGEITLSNIPGVAMLLVDFVKALQR